MFNKEKAKLEQPPAQAAEVKPSGPEARVFTMPGRYRHGSDGVMHEPSKKKEKQAVVEVRAPAAPSAPPPAPKPKALPKKRSSTKMIIIGGLVGITLLSLGGWYAVTLVSEPEPVVVATPVKTTTRPVVVVPDKPVETVVPDKKVEPAADPFATKVTPGVDSDSDGLSDTEEKQVYKTNYRLPDSDSDGFLDGNEVFHRYNPNGTAPGTLIGAGLVVLYEGQAGYELYQFSYPTVFEMETSAKGVVLDAQTGEGFRVEAVTKSGSIDLKNWVEDEIGIEDYVEDSTKTGLPLIQSDNLLVAYIDLGTGVLVFTYDTGTKARVDYLQTMKMMINSVELIGATSVLAETTTDLELTEESDASVTGDASVTVDATGSQSAL